MNEVFDTGFEHGKGIKQPNSNIEKLKLTGYKKLDEINPDFIQCKDIIIINEREYLVINTETDFANGKFTMVLESISKLNLNLK